MDKKKQTSTIAGVVFVGCMFIGLGLGMLYHKTAIGIMLGLGVGFISMGIFWAIMSRKSSDDKSE